MPNAFPSLHLGNGVCLCIIRAGQTLASGIAGFLSGTALATLSTGEHYVIDLVEALLSAASRQLLATAGSAMPHSIWGWSPAGRSPSGLAQPS